MNARENDAAGEAAGARGSLATESPPVRILVDEIIEKLESEGVDSVWAWFARPPHVIFYKSLDGYWKLVFWRGSVRVVVKLNDKYQVVSAYVEY